MQVRAIFALALAMADASTAAINYYPELESGCAWSDWTCYRRPTESYKPDCILQRSRNCSGYVQREEHDWMEQSRRSIMCTDISVVYCLSTPKYFNYLVSKPLWCQWQQWGAWQHTCSDRAAEQYSWLQSGLAAYNLAGQSGLWLSLRSRRCACPGRQSGCSGPASQAAFTTSVADIPADRRLTDAARRQCSWGFWGFWSGCDCSATGSGLQRPLERRRRVCRCSEGAGGGGGGCGGADSEETRDCSACNGGSWLQGQGHQGQQQQHLLVRVLPPLQVPPESAAQPTTPRSTSPSRSPSPSPLPPSFQSAVEASAPPPSYEEAVKLAV